MSPEIALTACHFLQDFTAMMLWGGLGFLTVLRPSPIGNVLSGRLKMSIKLAIALAAIVTVALLPLEAAILDDAWAEALNVSILKSLLSETNIGPIWVLQALAALALLTTLIRKDENQFGPTVLCAGMLLGTHALEGHSVMLNGFVGYALQIFYLIHVLSAGAWLGALPALLLLLRLSRSRQLRAERIFALQRFSALGQIAVALVVASGVANTSLILGQWPIHWSQPYQFLLALKISLVAAMMTIALCNRFVFLPQMKSENATTAGPLYWVTSIEFCLGVAVLGLVNFFSALDPV